MWARVVASIFTLGSIQFFILIYAHFNKFLNISLGLTLHTLSVKQPEIQKCCNTYLSTDLFWKRNGLPSNTVDIEFITLLALSIISWSVSVVLYFSFFVINSTMPSLTLVSTLCVIFFTCVSSSVSCRDNKLLSYHSIKKWFDCFSDSQRNTEVPKSRVMTPKWAMNLFLGVMEGATLLQSKAGSRLEAQADV